jgi:hypothetical protein
MTAKRSSTAPTDPEADDRTDLVAVRGPKAALGKHQRAFNRLIAQIRQHREQLAGWQAYRLRYLERVATELDPVQAALRDAQRRALLQMISLLRRSDEGSAARLSRRHRDALRNHVAAMIEMLLADGADAELESLRDTWCVPAGRKAPSELEVAEAILREMFGDAVVDGHQARDVDALFAYVHARRDAVQLAREQRHQQQAAARAAKRGRPSKAEQAAERREQFRREASQSVREIFRKLASTLHPDREIDPVERERKTLLMQRVNRAYAGNDLLALLSLQIEIEQIDSEHLAGASDVRISHFNEVLKEQLVALKVDIDEYAEPILLDLDLPPLSSEAAADHALNTRIAELRVLRRDIENETKALADPRRRRSVLDALAEHDPSDLDMNDATDMFELVEVLMDAAAPFAPAARARAGKPGR